jgi:hypothetical protein
MQATEIVLPGIGDPESLQIRAAIAGLIHASGDENVV